MNQSNLNQNEPRPETQNVTPQTTNEIELPKFASEEKSIGIIKINQSGYILRYLTPSI